MKQTIHTHSFTETQSLGTKFIQELAGSNILALHGDLGSGKTTFVQGIAQALGITRRIISPTFIIMRTYDIEKTENTTKFKRLYHIDLYRIETEHDVEGLGILEIMQNPENLVIIEWPEKIENLLPEARKDVFFTYQKDDDREIVFV